MAKVDAWRELTMLVMKRQLGSMTALEGLHVTGTYRTHHDEHMHQTCGLGSSQTWQILLAVCADRRILAPPRREQGLTLVQLTMMTLAGVQPRALRQELARPSAAEHGEGLPLYVCIHINICIHM